MTEFRAPNGIEALYSLGLAVTTLGEPVAPRGKKTTELLDVTSIIDDPYDVLLYGANRKAYRPAIGVIEGLLLLAGVSDPPLLQQANSRFADFQDGGALHGAYGPRLRGQLPFVAERLAEDADTRQAVCTIWDPLYDLHGATPRDLPCTVALIFRIRHGKLTLKTHMRSNDIWYGWCYDVLQFTLLQCTMANVLQVPVGPYVHHADSLHVYEVNDTALSDVHLPTGSVERPRLYGISPTEGFTPAERWNSVRVRALHVLYDDMFEPHTATERWLREQIDGVRRGRKAA